MNGYAPTKRSYTNVETGETYRLFQHETTHAHKLISESEKCGTNEVNGYYLCAFTGCTIKVKTPTGIKHVTLNMGEFYNTQEGETVTHRKFIGFTKFSKL